MSDATTGQLETALGVTIDGGDALAGILGHIVAAAETGPLTVQDARTARDAILTWNRATSHIRPLTT